MAKRFDFTDEAKQENTYIQVERFPLFSLIVSHQNNQKAQRTRLEDELLSTLNALEVKLQSTNVNSLPFNDRAICA